LNPNFTPISSLIGGALIGASASAMLLFNGKIAGISGILQGLTSKRRAGDVGWRAAFVAGLAAGAVVLALVHPAVFGPLPAQHHSVVRVVAAGTLVGVGTTLGNGCTSGHGVCGISRLSTRSIVATLTFMLTGAIATFITLHVFGGAS
jgi:uncharacterized membrane protein YedE/YeeE